MNTNYLHYKVELAFDRLEEALRTAQESGNTLEEISSI